MTREELLKVAKPMMVNLQVAKTMDRKSQTRRLIKDIICLRENPNSFTTTYNDKKLTSGIGDREYSTFVKIEDFLIERFSKWKVGDIIWVREPAKTIRFMTRSMDKNIALNYKYTSDGVTKWVDIPDRIKNGLSSQWFLERERGVPNGCIKEMARTFLRVTNVRVERIRNICIKDMIREGYPYITVDEYEKMGTVGDQEKITQWFINLWNSTAKDGYKYLDNPYIFAYTFEVINKRDI